MTPTITAFERSPDRGKGQARDSAYAGRWKKWANLTRFVFFVQSDEGTRASSPFILSGQIPTYEEGDLALFELGAIVFHIAERHAGAAAGRCECPSARDQLDVCRAQHGGAADPRSRNPHVCGARQDLVRGTPADPRGSRP